MSTQNVNVARFARNFESDFFGDFQTLCDVVMCFSIYGSSPLGGFQSVPLGRASRVSEGPNAWVIFPKGSTVSEVDHSNFTMRPINFSQSIGSRLKQSFARINNITPVESISGDPLIDEKPEDKSKVRRNAIIGNVELLFTSFQFCTLDGVFNMLP